MRTVAKRIFVYEQQKTGYVFTIPDPYLQLKHLDEVQRDVAQLLEHGLPGDSPEATLPSMQEPAAPHPVPIETAAS
jgi:hypothetical protein